MSPLEHAAHADKALVERVDSIGGATPLTDPGDICHPAMPFVTASNMTRNAPEDDRRQTNRM